MRSAPLLALLLTSPLTACVDELPEEAGPDAGSLELPDTFVTAGPPALGNQRTARFEFFSGDPDATFRCGVGDAEPTPCASPFAVAVDDGDWIFTVAAISAAGFADPTPARYGWEVDATPPQTRFERAPAAVDNSVRGRFELISDEEITGFECALDDGPFVPCATPYLTPALIEGAHRLAARATDVAGNVDADPAIHAWSVDTSTPDTVIDGAPSGTITVRTATITFSSPDAAPGSTFSCRRNSSLWVPCTSPWALDGLGDGLHTVQVRVTEPHQSVDPTPALASWTVDATAPVATITGGPSSRQPDPTPTFAFTVTGATMTECRVTSSTEAPDFAACTSPLTTAVLADGPHTFEVRGRDAAGNQAVATRDFAVDTVAPTIELTGPSGPVPDSSPRFGFTASETVTWRCRFDSDPLRSCTSPHEPPWSLAEGAHVFTLVARDQAGLETTIDRAFTVDRYTVVMLDAAPSPRTDDATPSFGFRVSDAITIRCRIDSDGLAPCTSPYTAPPLADGPHSFLVTVTDAAGNTDSAARSFTVDTSPLDVAINGGPTGETQVRRPTFTWTTSGAVAALACRYDAGLFDDCAAAQAVDLPDGPHTFEVRVAADSGATASATRSFTVDTVAPGAAFDDGPTGTITATTVTFAFTTSGAPAVTECRLFRDGAATGGYAPCASPHTIDLAPPSAPYPYVFEVRVRDHAGNQWSAYRSFTYAAP